MVFGLVGSDLQRTEQPDRSSGSSSGHLRPEGASSAALSLAEDGSDRTAGRRDRARLQQPAHRDTGLQPDVARTARPAQPRLRASKAGDKSQRAGGLAHKAVAGLQQKAGAST